LAAKVYRELSKRKFLEIVELSENLDVVETVVEKGGAVKEIGTCGLIIAVKRDGETQIATGSTVLKPGDRLICVVERR
jgi:trk system potassium uptake protein TrkA